jgi:hypothetical protein
LKQKLKIEQFKEINGVLHVFVATFFGQPVYAPVCAVKAVKESDNPESTKRLHTHEEDGLRPDD